MKDRSTKTARPVEDQVFDKIDKEKLLEFVESLRGRQVQIFYLMFSGMSQSEIARDCEVSNETISQAVRQIRKKAEKVFKTPRL